MKKRNHDGLPNKKNVAKKKPKKYLSSFFLAFFIVLICLALHFKYHSFLMIYQEKLTELTPHARYSGQLKLPTIYNSQILGSSNEQQDQPAVSMEINSALNNVVERYESIIKNSTKWVYTSLEANMEKVGSNFFAQNKDLKIYPNWQGCAKGYFKVADMSSCFAWLTCDDLKDIKIEKRINHGLGKEVFEADWNGVTVAYVRLRPERLHQEPIRSRVRTGIENLIRLNPSPYVTQVLGYCFEGENSIMISELAPLGDLRDFVGSQNYAELDRLGRLGVVIRLARVFAFMHKSPIGKRVNCDMTKITRALSQFLVTSDFRIVANDLDDLPLVSREDNKLANCTWGKIEDRDPIFQAPEERLHHTSIPNPFDEKADVWKLANMTYTIMYRSVSPSKKEGIDELMAPLEGFLGRCQAQNPEDRPTATEMVIELIEQYKKAANFL